MTRPIPAALALLVALTLVSCQSSDPVPPSYAATFSIAAVDPDTGEIGIAVASRIPSVGSIVPFIDAELGAIATQSKANVGYGPDGLALLEKDQTPEEVIAALTKDDPEKDFRQVGIVDIKGRSASFTGARCIPSATGKTGEGYAIQGNLLAGPEVIDAMEKAFLADKTNHLPDRLLAALLAGDQAGGDLRGKQSAALLVHRKDWGYAGLNNRFRDIRVDDHKDPVPELKRVLEAHRRIFKRPKVRAE